MIAIADVNELNKICRKYLISQSGIDGSMVRNSLSLYGEELDQLLYKTTYDSVNPCQAIILFELSSRDSSSNVSMTETDDSVTEFKSYSMNIVIYGDASATIAATLIARLRTEAIRSALYAEGVYIERVTDDVSVNEFKNNVMWHRHDFKIDLTCKLSITQVSPDNAFASVEISKIIEEGDD